MRMMSPIGLRACLTRRSSPSRPCPFNLTALSEVPNVALLGTPAPGVHEDPVLRHCRRLETNHDSRPEAGVHHPSDTKACEYRPRVSSRTARPPGRESLTYALITTRLPYAVLWPADTIPVDSVKSRNQLWLRTFAAGVSSFTQVSRWASQAPARLLVSRHHGRFRLVARSLGDPASDDTGYQRARPRKRMPRRTTGANVVATGTCAPRWEVARPLTTTLDRRGVAGGRGSDSGRFPPLCGPTGHL